jgi:hypothetical protein
MDYTITNKQIHEAVNHAIRKVLLEYGRINANENDGIFNFNAFDISVSSNDHNPPHFHVRTDDGINLKFRIDNGAFLKDVKPNLGKDSDKKYIIENIPSWLDGKNSKLKGYTHREYAIYLWRACHDNKYEEGYNGY